MGVCIVQLADTVASQAETHVGVNTAAFQVGTDVSPNTAASQKDTSLVIQLVQLVMYNITLAGKHSLTVIHSKCCAAHGPTHHTLPALPSTAGADDSACCKV